MPNLPNAKGQPVKMSFLDIFGASTSSRSNTGVSRMERKKPKKEESSPSTETSPQSTAATQAPTEPTTNQPGAVEWTRLEELALLGMKAQDMSWKEINEALPGKDLEDIKKKYRVLYADAPANVKPKDGEVKEESKKEESKKEESKKEEEKKDDKNEAKPDEAKDAEESKKESSEDNKNLKENKPWKRNQKGHKAQKGKGKAKEPKSENVKLEEAKPEETKGMLIAKATAEEKGKGGELKSIDGHPVIFVDDDEELDFNELLYLYGLNARYDEQKWISVDSRFFDKFGKRVGTEKLKEKLAGIL